jgi:hypothetical protein
MRNLCLLLICLMLAACAPATGGDAKARKLLNQEQLQALRNELMLIPGVHVITNQPLTLGFPVGTMFTEGSALPFPGTEALEALTTLIKQSELHWEVTVRAASGEGEKHDSELANTRARILQTYFKSFAVNLDNIAMTARAEAGDPLELKLIQ